MSKPIACEAGGADRGGAGRAARWPIGALAAGLLAGLLIVGVLALTRPVAEPAMADDQLWREPDEISIGGAAPWSVYNPHAGEDRSPMDLMFSCIEINDLRLDEAVEWFRRETGMNLVVNWAALGEGGINPGLKVTVITRQATLRRALELLLESAGDGNVRLEALLRGAEGSAASADTPGAAGGAEGIITITLADEAYRAGEIRVYDVRELIAAPWPESVGTAPDFHLQVQRPWFVEPQPVPRSVSERAHQLAVLIQETVDPTSWADSGGSVGAIGYYNGRFIVRQNTSNHRVLAALLREFREEQLRGAKGPAKDREDRREE